MTMQEWKAKINGFFQPKSQAERQKMMKYLVVMPAAILCGAVILWLLYSSLNKSDERVGDAFNTEIPEGENDGMKDKMSEYEAAEAAKEKETRQQTVSVLDTLTAATPQDSDMRQPSAVETSAQAYQEVQPSLDDFFVSETNEGAQVAELQARIDELEAQTASIPATPATAAIHSECITRCSKVAQTHGASAASISGPISHTPKKVVFLWRSSRRRGDIIFTS